MDINLLSHSRSLGGSLLTIRTCPACITQVVLENHESTRRGLILPDVFLQTLEENNVFLPKKTARELVGQFQVANGGIQVAKFLKWVELSRPADHIDPELVFARLPQPYRRIMKILDKDILDASWELIKTQSTRFKAEAMAASSTPRSTRSIALNNLDEVLDADDYEAAKKRCCKVSERTAMPDSLRPTCITQHPSLPFVLVALEDPTDAERQSKVDLNLYSTLSHQLVINHSLPLNQNAEPPADSSSEPRKQHRVTAMTPIRVRSVRDSFATCVVGVHVTESSTIPPTTEDQPASTIHEAHLYFFQIRGIKAQDGSGTIVNDTASFQLVATAKVQSLAWVELSQDAQFVAVSAAPGGITVFRLPVESDVTDPSEPISVVDLNASSAFLKIESDVIPGKGSPATAHFVVKPASTPSSIFQPEEAYAIVVCHQTKVLKYSLRGTSALAANSIANVPVETPSRSWDHIASITASGTDATTQYVAVILANGSILVWDTLEEIDHAFLPSPPTVDTSACRQVDSVADALVMYRDEYLVALSALRQQVCFYDIKDRMAPKLLRVVTPPATPTQQGPNADGAKFTLLVETARVLDVPVAIVGYSTGFLMLYDMRNAEAIGSIRYRSPRVSDAMSNLIVASKHGISAAHASALEVYDWYQLFLASFPSFEHLLNQRHLTCVSTMLSCSDQTNTVPLTCAKLAVCTGCCQLEALVPFQSSVSVNCTAVIASGVQYQFNR